MVRRSPDPLCRPAAGLCALLVLLGALSARAHEFHVSTAEVEYNPQSQHLEVALEVLPDDLEDALSRHQHRLVSLDATEGVDQLILDYLRQGFRVVDARGHACSLLWVGKEVSFEAAWLYFEVPVDPDVAWRLEDRVLFDLTPEQLNLVRLKVRGERSAYNLTPDRPGFALPPLQPESPAHAEAARDPEADPKLSERSQF